MVKLNCTTGNVSGLKFKNEKGVKKHKLTYEETDQRKSIKNTGRILYKRRWDTSRRIQ